jgi:O-acetyl-ADP-ribose deacetylase (regulator of RNase III)
MTVDAIVNTTNIALQMGVGVSGAIFRAAGAEKLQAECDKLAPIRIGEAVATPGFDLPAKYVIHAVGPVYRDGKRGEEQLLRSAYTSSLRLAVEMKCESIAFPLISSGTYGYPRDKALNVATTAIQDFLLNSDRDIDVSLVVFDRAAFALSRKLRGEVQSFIDENYIARNEAIEADSPLRNNRFMEEEAAQISFSMPAPCAPCAPPAASADGEVFTLDEPFSAVILRIIDAKGMSDAEVYRRANIDRRLFSKIRRPDYRPGKRTVVALAVALKLSSEETRALLAHAGFALSRSVLFDVIVDCFIRKGEYNIFKINNVLFDKDQPLLGGS